MTSVTGAPSPMSTIDAPATAGLTGRGKRMGDETVVVSATGVVSLLNYAYTLLLLWLLPTREFAEAGSISALLLICGTISGAALPWVLAQEVLRSKSDHARRRLAISFCLFATVLQGVAAGLATCLIVAHYASGWVLVAAFCSVLLIFLDATASGFFQGLQRFRLIAMLKVSEVVVKLGTGTALIALGAGASGAIAGFALGAAVVAGVGLAYMARDVHWSWSAMAGRHLWASTQGLMAIQAGVAVLASMDVIIGSLVLGTQPALATYQAANILGRVPVFIGAAISIVIFARMVAGQRHPRTVIRESIRLYVAVSVPIALITATLPAPLVGILFPARYGHVASILPWSALGGLAMGAVNLTTTYFQATGIFRRTTSILAFGVALCAALEVFGLRLHGIIGLAVAVVIGGSIVASTLLRQVTRTWPGALRGLWRPSLIVVVGCVPLVVLRHDTTAWCLWALGCALWFCLRNLLRISSTAAGGGGSTKPRVLHLGYEDPRRPGAGGGSVRTHEINRRLSDTFDITVVCSRYRGARTRVEDGVRYVHSGMTGGDFPERLSYFASLPLALLRYSSDLVVEDFGAPFSSVSVPWMTDRPVLGVVQWLFAKEKSAQYHLPFHWVEGIGVRSHRSMIAVSDDLGAALTERNPRAEVTVVANGLDQAAFCSYDCARSDIVYLGRLEIAQKGLDLLLEAYARVAASIAQDLVLGGDGPDRQVLVEQARRLGIADRVRFVGRVSAEERFGWLAGADLLAMPSRYETFGMVAAEALAVRTPVVAFDIPCLRSLVDDRVGAVVPAFDVEGFAEALVRLATDEGLRRRQGEAGPDRVGALNWDDLAVLQGGVYRQVLSGTDDPPPVPSETDDTSEAGGAGETGGTDQTGDPEDTDRCRSVVSLLADQGVATPERVAVVDGDTQWTYAELHRAAGSVTGALTDRNIGSGDSVGVCLPRSKRAIAAMIGIWGAGATYVPLDPEYPAARLAEMCDRAGVTSLVADAELVATIDPTISLIDPSIIAPSSEQEDTAGGPSGDPDPDAAAYILFTSGSSGRPKAVQVAHRSLTSVADWIRSTLRPDELAITTTSVSFSFDPFILEVLGPLMMGGTVRVVPSALALAEMGSGATMLANTPSVVGELLRAGRLPSSLRTVIVGGESLSDSLATELFARTSISRLINTYGPTETTVLVTAHEVVPPISGPVPIGRQLPGADIVLLDEDSVEVAPGSIGEICISGPQVADGYRGDPEATAERFTRWAGKDGAPVRIYRTGDLGRCRHDGVIEFCGRRDRQLKLRGFRIEPGEIEVMLCRHPDVTQAVVTPTGDGPNAALVAYVTTTADGTTPSDLRGWLRGSLPRFMVPTQVMVVDAFPTTPNGKVAVDLLPTCRPLRFPGAAQSPAAATPNQRDRSAVSTVALLAGRILQLEGPIRAEDDFLDDLGGSSLALFQLLTAMEEEFSCRIEIGRIIEDTTIGGLSALVGLETDGPSYLSVNSDGVKQPIYMIHAYLGTALRYRRLGAHLSADRPLIGIQVQEFDSLTRPTRNTVAQMAEEATDQIRRLQPAGPYVVGGHSAGGLVAYEAARHLVDSGQEVSLVVLIDSPVPRSSLHYLWAEAVLNWPDIRVADAAERMRRLRAAIDSRRARFRRDPPSDRVSGAILRSHRASNLAVMHYQPGPYAGDVAVLRTRQGAAMAVGKSDLGWGSVVTGQVTSIEIPGLHNTIFEEPQLGIVGGRLDQLLDRLERLEQLDRLESHTSSPSSGLPTLGDPGLRVRARRRLNV